MLLTSEAKLRDTYPALFAGGCLSVRCEDGWYKVIDKLLYDLTNIYIATNLLVTIDGIGEKYGSLRIGYMSSFRDGDKYAEVVRNSWYRIVRSTVLAAEREASVTCESCGAKGVMCCIDGGRWYKVLCSECQKERNYSPFKL